MKEIKSDLENNILNKEENSRKDKYLTFHLANNNYAIEMIFVEEVIDLIENPEIPHEVKHFNGILNYKGKEISLIDVRLRFGLPEGKYPARASIIIITKNNITIGLIVDEIVDIMNISQNQISVPPKTRKGSLSSLIKGIGKVHDQVKIILDMDNLLDGQEISKVEINSNRLVKINNELKKKQDKVLEKKNE